MYVSEIQGSNFKHIKFASINENMKDFPNVTTAKYPDENAD